MCGEYLLFSSRTSPSTGSPPHVWGIQTATTPVFQNFKTAIFYEFRCETHLYFIAYRRNVATAIWHTTRQLTLTPNKKPVPIIGTSSQRFISSVTESIVGPLDQSVLLIQ